MAVLTLESLVLGGFVLVGEKAVELRRGASVSANLPTPAPINPTRHPMPDCQVITRFTLPDFAEDYLRAADGAGRSRSSVGVRASVIRQVLPASESSDGGTRSAAFTHGSGSNSALDVTSVAGSVKWHLPLMKQSPSARTRGRKAG